MVGRFTEMICRLPAKRDQNAFGGPKSEIGPDLCHISEQSPSGVGK